MSRPESVARTGSISTSQLLSSSSRVRNRALPTVYEVLQERYELAVGPREWFFDMLNRQISIVCCNVEKARVFAFDAEEFIPQFSGREVSKNIAYEAGNIVRVGESGLSFPFAEDSDFAGGNFEEPRNECDETASLKL